MPLPPLTTFDGKTIPFVSALPDGGNGAGLIVIDDGTWPQERLSFLCDDLSHEGYIALCPLLWTNGKQEPDAETCARDLLSVLAYVRKLPGCGGKVGTLGFGRAGLLSFLMATRCDVDCAVLYEPEHIGAFSGEIADIRRPALVLMGGVEPPAPDMARLVRAFKRNPSLTPMHYPNVAPDFYRAEAAGFNAEAARQAHAQTMAFLAEHLNR